MRNICLLVGLFLSLTMQAQTVTDIDGNVYTTVNIGTQVWMAENLETTRFRDGSGIPMIADSSSWGNSGHPGFCWYANASVYKDKLGALYNWHAVGSGKLAPEGWHVPDEQEWNVLVDYLGGPLFAGGKMKSRETVEVGSGYWFTPNTGATNQSGFSGLGAGAREMDGQFHYFFSQGFWWTATGDSTGFATYRQLSYNYPDVVRGYLKRQTGMSVRCIKDSEQGLDDEGSETSLRIWPNPVQDHLILDNEKGRWREITIFGVLGEQVLRVKLEGSTIRIDVHALSKGIYFVAVTGLNKTVYHKMIRK